MLNTFQFVNNNEIISPNLTTTQQYGVWLEREFGEYVAKQELYMKSVKKGGNSVLEWHPGTRIGKWFDSTKTSAKCWYVSKDSSIINRLIHYGIIDSTAIDSKIPNTDISAVRLYTAEQIELYIRTCIDSSFSMTNHIVEPMQIKVRNTEITDIVIPTISAKRTLF